MLIRVGLILHSPRASFRQFTGNVTTSDTSILPDCLMISTERMTCIFFAHHYLFESEYTDYELREMDVLRQNAGSCIRSTTRMPREHMSKTDMEEKLI